MNSTVGWALAVVAVALGYAQWGWRGAIVGITLAVFWLLLQFSRAMRVMRQAGEAPVGHVDNAVMLHSKLRTGMRLMEILPLTRSLGVKVADEPETFVWSDAAGDSVRIELADGRCVRWELTRRSPQT